MFGLQWGVRGGTGTAPSHDTDQVPSAPDLEVLRSFQNQIAAIQRDAVWWLHTVVPSISKLAPKDYVHWYGP